MSVTGIERIFSINLRKILCNVLNMADRINEIRLRAGQPLMVISDNKERFVKSDGEITLTYENAYIVTVNEIRETMEYISNYSLYAYEEEMKQGYITVAGGHRIGICGKAIIENNTVKTLRYISFINIRIAHEIIGCSDRLIPKIYKDSESIYNTLIISPPGRGKTTLLRDLVRNISNGYNGYYRGLNIGIADERSEIAACYLGIPQNDVGIRTDVIDGIPKEIGIMMLIRTMSPNVIAVDEIGSKEDIKAIRQGINCGCRFICTVHGDDLEDIRNKPVLGDMIKEKIFRRYIVINKWDKAERYKVERYKLVEND
ncbi:MAG: stage III sporulation protein AA [Lachnospiraceae bacterium]|nr:stage III sporulation protein AA [Lachnospiraceae bacterium]